jgi:multidrug efflux pump subunit AcrB
MVPFLGSNFFPSVDSGQMLIHVRVPVGTRIEETAARFARIEQAIRRVIPAEEIVTMTDNIGMPASSINTVYNNTGMMGTQDGDFQIALSEEHRRPPSTCASCARCCRKNSRTPPSRSRRPTSSARS